MNYNIYLHFNFSLLYHIYDFKMENMFLSIDYIHHVYLYNFYF